MKRMYLLLVVAVLFVAPACTHTTYQPKNIIVLLDLSQSRDSTLLAWYKMVIAKHILPHMGKADKLIVLPLDKNSVAGSSELFLLDLAQYQYGNEFGGMQADEIEAQDIADTITHATVIALHNIDGAYQQRKIFRQQTDVFGAVQECTRYIDTHYQNLIILLSDMLQTETVQFPAFLTQPGALDSACRQWEMFNLQESNVLVLTGPVNSSSLEFNLVKKFWMEYFRRSNATFLSYSSGAVSKMEAALDNQ